MTLKKKNLRVTELNPPEPRHSVTATNITLVVIKSLLNHIVLCGYVFCLLVGFVLSFVVLVWSSLFVIVETGSLIAQVGFELTMEFLTLLYLPLECAHHNR